MKLSAYIYMIIKKLRLNKIVKSNIDKTSRVYSGSEVINSTVGKYSYLSYDNIISFTTIGDFCSIASGCIIGGASHPAGWVSTSPVFYRGKNPLKKNFAYKEYNSYKKTIIGHDVWIGSRVIIKSGVNIGNGAILGMGSVVTKDVPPYEIWAGNPARFIRKRFEDEKIKKINDSKWWSRIDQISLHFEYIDDVDKFISLIE